MWPRPCKFFVLTQYKGSSIERTEFGFETISYKILRFRIKWLGLAEWDVKLRLIIQCSQEQIRRQNPLKFKTRKLIKLRIWCLSKSWTHIQIEGSQLSIMFLYRFRKKNIRRSLIQQYNLLRSMFSESAFHSTLWRKHIMWALLIICYIIISIQFDYYINNKRHKMRFSSFHGFMISERCLPLWNSTHLPHCY